MRLKAIEIHGVAPIKSFEVSDLSNVVVLAGPNGVGKTRIFQAILKFFQNPSANPNVNVQVSATSKEEIKAWGKADLDSKYPQDAALLGSILRRSQRRTKWKSSIINFDAERAMQKLKPLVFTWDIIDPWDEEIGWESTFSFLKDRFQDTIHSIFKKMTTQRTAIALRAIDLKKSGQASMPLTFDNPLDPFKVAFSLLLSPKELVDPDPKNQELEYTYEGQKLPISTLSSGEREVVQIVFDFILRGPEHCIILFDEPELHLHPELSYRMLQTLKAVAGTNQFILSTHSPDIISSSLENSVVFVAPPVDSKNQAIQVKEGDETNQALRLLGQSIGVIALGKRIVLIEGTNSSLDKQVYGSILKNKLPEFVLVPSGGKASITSFSVVNQSILSKSIWGIDFFMLCDRDAVPLGKSISDVEGSGEGRLRVLKKYHLENYFLDEAVIAEVFKPMEPPDSWLADESKIRQELRRIAQQNLAYASALKVTAKVREACGNVDVMPKDCFGADLAELESKIAAKGNKESARILSSLDEVTIRALVRDEVRNLQESLDKDDDRWKEEIPGRPLLNIFASKAKMDVGRLKTLYLNAAESSGKAPFREIQEIFEGFKRVTSSVAGP